MAIPINFSCFDNYIGFQCILFRQAFQTELSTFLLFWEGFKKFLLFGLFTLGIFGGPEKDREFCFCWSFILLLGGGWLGCGWFFWGGCTGSSRSLALCFFLLFGLQHFTALGVFSVDGCSSSKVHQP